MERRHDGALVFSTTWKNFAADWRTAPQKHKVVLDDGRPAVLRETEEGHNYLTIHRWAWQAIRPRLKEAMAFVPAKKRERLCEGCRAPLKVHLERTDHWIFTCDQCKTTEIHGKDQPGIGGTWGAGEREKT